MAAMRAGDVVIGSQRGTNAYGDCFLSYVKVSEPRHQRASVEIVYLLLKKPNGQHSPVHLEPFFGVGIDPCDRGLLDDFCFSRHCTLEIFPGKTERERL